MTTKKHSLTADQNKKATGSKETSEESFHFKDEAIWRPLYPFTSHYQRIGGFQYHYVDEGPENIDPNKPVLLLSHGNPTWSFYWREVIKAFRDEYRVIAVDHIGCGLSEKPSDKDYPYHLERRISDMTALIKKLNLQNIIMIAHDWGGAIGMGAAVANSKRISKIVLMNTAAFLSDNCPFRIRLCRIPIFSRLLIQGMNIFSQAALKMASARPASLSREVRTGLLAPYDTWANRVAVFRFVQDIPLCEKHVSYQTLKNIQEGLSLFREQPVCLVWGMQDWCFPPEYIKRFLQYLPEAEVHRLQSAGHYLLEDDPQEVIRILRDFIAK